MMKVVSNTSPLIFLSKLDALKLLPQCFSHIVIPKAVENELQNIILPDYIECKDISESGLCYVKGAIGNLHAGELEAMVLAQETKSALILLDDLTARNKAKRLGLQVMGTVGVLKLASAKGIISADQFSKYLDLLVNRYGLYISHKIIEQLKSTLC